MTIKPKILPTQDALSGVLIAAAVLVIGFIYGLGHVYLVPDPGFSYSGRWHVINFSSKCESGNAANTTTSCNTGRDTLEIGDRITTIRDPRSGEELTIDEYNTRLTVIGISG